MSELLILLSHPNFAGSHANRTWIDAVQDLPGLEIAHLDGLYPDGQIDVDREVARVLAAKRFALQFPIQWYSTPPLLKAWQDTVLTRMFYINPKTEGDLIAGRPMLVAATSGNRPQAYTAAGINLFPLPELLRPLHSTAHRCGLTWLEPFITYENNKPSAEKLRTDAAAYRVRIQALLRSS